MSVYDRVLITGGNGMLATLGGRWGGWGLYLLNGKPVFNYNMLILAQYRWAGEEALTTGKHTIVFDFTYDGPGIAKSGSGVLKVDGRDLATSKLEHTIPFLLPADIDEGDWIELGQLGAYGACLRTRFNGFESTRTAEVADPPLLATPGYDG